MRKISDTIARLAALQKRHTAASGGAGSFNHLTALTGFGSNPGDLKARQYLPANLPNGAPLVVVLHGCTQDAAGYDHHSGWSRLADEAGFALLYPEQNRGNNPNLCFNWFLPEDARRDSGEALSIRQMVESMVVKHRLDRRRIFVCGLSAGGAMAAAMLASYPEVFAGGAIIAGLAYGGAKTVPEAFDRMRGHGGPTEVELQYLLRSATDHEGPWPRLSIWQGTADQTVAPSNAEALAGQWRAVHGVDRAPTYSTTNSRLTKHVWSNGAGDALIEVNMISGMGHGTPLGHDGLGRSGPYMLDVGISSTREISRFWRVANPLRPVQARENQGDACLQSLASASAATKPSGEPEKQNSSAVGVKKIIEGALRSAGLMR